MGGPSAPGWAGRTRVLQLFTEHCDVLSAGPQSAGLQAWGEMPTCKALWDQGYYMQMAHYNVLPYRRTHQPWGILGAGQPCLQTAWASTLAQSPLGEG